MKTYTQDEIHMIAEVALNAAIFSVQDDLGQTDGGVAGIYFSGHREEIVLDILKSYIQTEINFGCDKKHDPECPAVDGFGCYCA
jgi:hypothetical protein